MVERLFALAFTYLLGYALLWFGWACWRERLTVEQIARRVAAEPSKLVMSARTIGRTVPRSGRSISMSAMPLRTATARRWASSLRIACLSAKY